MKLKKSFSFSDKNQIWRLLISNTDQLVIETRNTDNKEVFFHAVDLTKGKKLIKNFQMDEKYWIGIEEVYDNIIFFHQFAKPDMPDHKGIIAFDLVKEEILWQDENYFFLAVHNNKLYAAKRKFEGQDYFALNYQSGELIEEVDKNNETLNNLLIYNEEKFADYTYPINIKEAEEKLAEIISKEIKNKTVIENIDYINVDNLLMFNYYITAKNNLLDNVFVVYDIKKGKRIFSDIVNKNTNSVSPDTFFCYKNFLILLKNKSELLAYKII